MNCLPDDAAAGPENGVARLFPLHGAVLFPYALLPLRIYEPRYKQMTEDALRGDRGVTIVLPMETEEPGPPPLHSVGCFGTIHYEERLANGEFKYVLRGAARVQLTEELKLPGKLYRSARTQVLADHWRPGQGAVRRLQQGDILRSLRRLVPQDTDSAQAFLQYLSHECTMGMFADIVAYAAPLAATLKQQLLATLDVDNRLEILVDAMRELVHDSPEPTESAFPPPFSAS